MHDDIENANIYMVRPDLGKLPEFEMPSPCTLRTYLSGDEAAWKQIHVVADTLNTFTNSTFPDQFGTDTSQIVENQFYIADSSGRAVGTATAWHCRLDGRPADDGLVHWVAVAPDHQGKGLSKPLLSAVCARLRDRGFERAYLGTSSARPAALGLYLSFGFVPDIREPAHRAVWGRVRARLGHRVRWPGEG